MGQPRIAIYARHSTDKQNPLSSADQTAACEEIVTRLGGTLVGTYADPEVSGYSRDRPGLTRMLADEREGAIDMIVCEALDRIARPGQVRPLRIELHHLGEGLLPLRGREGTRHLRQRAV